MTNGQSISLSYPLLPSQEGIYYAWMSRHDATCWNLPVCMTYGPEIDRDRLREAIRAIVAQRETLRLQLTIDADGHPRQYIDSTLIIDVPCREMSEAAALDYRDHHFVRPFAPFAGEPLCRFEIVSTPEHHYLLFDLHHLIGDGVTISHAFLGIDLPRAYARLPLDKQDYGLLDASLSQEALYDTERYENDRHYFLDHFQEHPFTTLCNTPTIPWGRYLRKSKTTDRNAIDTWCKANNTPPNIIFSAAFSLVLSRLSGERETAFLTLFHGRTDRRLRNVWGMFVSTLPQLASHQPSDTIGSLLQQHRHEQFRSLRHNSYPLTHFCNDLNRTPMTTFGFQSGQIPESIALDGRLYAGMQLPYTESRNELSCMIYVHDTTYEIRVDCSSAWHDADYLNSFAQAVATVVAQIITQPSATPLDRLALICPEEQCHLEHLGSGESLSWPEEETLTNLIHRQYHRRPSATAIHDIHGIMSYEQLWLSSGHLSCMLCHHDIGHGDIVAIALPHDHRFLVSALAVMRCGAAYLPLDTSHPPQRQQFLLSDSNARLLIDETTYARLTTDETDFSPPLIDKASIDYSRVSDMAYLMYTSGTTGKPKGVMISHRALCHFTYCTAHLWHLDEESRISCHAPFIFDASVEDLYPALTCGGTVFLPDDAIRHDLHALRHYLSEHHITGGCYTPQFAMLLTEGHPLDVAYLCVGGDRMTHVPATNGRIINTYGPTEFTVNATYYHVSGEQRGNIPIGRPLPDLIAFVTDYAGNLLPRGMTGELCLGGPQMAMGYWHRPEETSQHFVFASFAGITLYHTGDYVRWNEEGQLEYIGRRDDQIELNGQRIEPGEIETILRQHDAIKDACVSVQSSGGQDILCVHYTQALQKENSAKNTEDDIKHFIRQRLPSYMVPQLWHCMDRLPLSANGKVDRNQLPHLIKSRGKEERNRLKTKPNLANSILGERNKAAISSKTEMLLLSLFRQVLGNDDVGVTDSFFDMGGTSLSAMELVSKAREAHLAIDYAMLYRWSDVRSLTEHLRQPSHCRSQLWHVPKGFVPISIPKTTHLPEHSTGHLLLTGATGFLGCHILAEYLRQENGIVHCLVRDHDEHTARERLLAIVARIMEKDAFSCHSLQIHVTHGDISHDGVFDALDSANISTLIHCAADVNHYAPEAHLWDVNVEGTRHVLEYCLRHGIRLVHLSTLSVGGVDSHGQVHHLSEDEYYTGQSFVEPYDYTKFMSEHIVLEAMEKKRLAATIVRPGFLVSPVGQAEHTPNRTDLLATIDQLAGTLGILPRRIASIPITYSHVDEAAREILSIATENNGKTIRHLRMVKEKTVSEMMHLRHPALQWVEESYFLKALESMKDKERHVAIFAILHALSSTR